MRVQRALVVQLLLAVAVIGLLPFWRDILWLNRTLTILLLTVPLAWVSFVLWAIHHCIHNPALQRHQRVTWVVAILVTFIGGAWVYAAKHAGGTL